MRGNSTYLHVAFGNIKWGDTSMGKAACKNTAKHALGIVRRVVGDRAKIPGDASSAWSTEKRIIVTTHRASHFPDGARCDIGV